MQGMKAGPGMKARLGRCSRPFFIMVRSLIKLFPTRSDIPLGMTSVREPRQLNR